MIGMLSLCLTLASASEPSNALDTRAIDEVVRWMQPEDMPAARWTTLAANVRARMRERMIVEPVRDTKNYLAFWKPSLAKRVDALADDLGRLLGDADRVTPGVRARRVLGIMTDLAAALGRNSGNVDSYAGVVALGAFLGTTSALGIDASLAPDVAVAVGAGTGLASGIVTTLAELGLDLPRRTLDQRTRAAEDAVARFWRRVGRRWAETVPSAPPADADWVEIARRANQALNVSEEVFAQTCEDWLGTEPPTLDDASRFETRTFNAEP